LIAIPLGGCTAFESDATARFRDLTGARFRAAIHLDVVGDPSTGYRHKLFRPDIKSAESDRGNARAGFCYPSFGKKATPPEGIDFEQVHE
jgi:hypothetical protein